MRRGGIQPSSEAQMWARPHFKEKREREGETRDGSRSLLPHGSFSHLVSGEGTSPGETLTRDDADGDVHVVDLLREGGRHHARADQQAAQHHHQAVSKPAAQDRGERGCRGERTGLSPQGVSLSLSLPWSLSFYLVTEV